jgi:hypothetical protein
MNRRPRKLRNRPADEGSILTLTLVLVLVCSMIIGGLLTFTDTVLRSRPPLEERTRGVESAKSAMRTAIMMQVSKGAIGCMSQADYPTGTFNVNGFTSNVSCSVLDFADTGRNRYGVVTTQNNPASTALTGYSGSTGARKDIDGDVFLNGGNLTTGTQDILVKGDAVGNAYRIEYSNSVATAPGVTTAPVVPVAARYTAGALPAVECDAAAAGAGLDAYAVGGSDIVAGTYTHTHPICSAANSPSTQNIAWWQRVGDAPANTEAFQYPRLPALPLYDRDNKSVTQTSTCKMLYPGRYDDALTLTGAGNMQYYFASGIYQFMNTVTISAGAKVVFGEGRVGGCAVDSDLALDPTALTNHAITGKGATILLDGAGRLVVQNSSLTINRRISTPATRGSEGIAIRTVNTGTSTADIQVPRDTVQPSEYPCVYTTPGVCAVPFAPNPADSAKAMDIGAYSVLLKGTSTPLKYTGSSLAQNTDAVLLDFTGTSSVSQSGFETDGYVFVPNAQFTLKTPTSGGFQTDYFFRARNGIVASRVQLDTKKLPTSPTSNWFLGVQAQPTRLKVSLTARATSPSGRQSVSRAIVEVRSNGAYAVNSWTVDPDMTGTTTPQAATTTTIPATTTTVKPTTTTSTSTSTTTTSTTTTTIPATTTTVKPTTTTSTTTTTIPATTTTVMPTTTTTTIPATTTTVKPTTTTSTTSTTTTTTTIPATTTTVANATCPTATSTTWRGEYYNTIDFTGARKICRNDSSPNFDWGSGSPGTGVTSDAFSVRWTNTQFIGGNTTVRVTIGSDDGYRFFVDGVKKAECWCDRAFTTSYVDVPLTTGSHTFVLEYYERSGDAQVSLTY